jgi:hypothetical protein
MKFGGLRLPCSTLPIASGDRFIVLDLGACGTRAGIFPDSPANKTGKRK